MKFLLIAIVLFMFTKTDTSDIQQKWEDFKVKYNKMYASPEEERHRFKTFVESYKYVGRFNDLQAQKGEISENTLELGINQYSDLSLEEVPKGLNVSEFESLYYEVSFITYDNYSEETIPDSLDWRKKGIVTPVKNQLNCASCWAFSAVGSLEAIYYKNHQKEEILSEQFLVDCDFHSMGCRGGYPSLALNFISKVGIPTDKDYPYTGVNEKCYYAKKSPVKINGVVKLPAGNENVMKQVVATAGPISAIVFVTEEFKHYKKGVLKANCSSEYANHAIVIVGYDTDTKEGDYWIVKNSWGTNWGEEGYIKIPRNRNSYCRIADLCYYPTDV